MIWPGIMMLLIRCDIFFLCVIYEGKLFEFGYVHGAPFPYALYDQELCKIVWTGSKLLAKHMKPECFQRSILLVRNFVIYLLFIQSWVMKNSKVVGPKSERRLMNGQQGFSRIHILADVDETKPLSTTLQKIQKNIFFFPTPRILQHF